MNNLNTFEECCNFLSIPTDLPKCHFREKQIQAVYKLSVCMKAWNREDGFYPDEKATYLQKNVGYAPYFILRDGRLLSSGTASYGSYAGIVNASAYAAAITIAYFGLRLCLGTRNRAIEFGEVFIETFNELI